MIIKNEDEIMNSGLFFLTMLAVMSFGAASINSATYYVSVNGSNNNDGLTPQTAFATLQHAADIVEEGDSVLVFEGNYVGFDIRINGTQNLPIVFKAIEDNVIIDEPNSTTPDGINIENASWIVIDGFEVADQPRAGIRAAVSDFITIKNNYCHNNQRWGIFTGFTDDITVENNTCSYSVEEHGIYVSNSSDRPVIRDNHCFNNYVCGIHMNGDISMGGDGIISNAVVEGNIIHDNGTGGGSGINMDGVQNSEIFNNLLYNNHASGIAMYMIDAAEGAKNNKVYNNTIFNPTVTRWNILMNNESTGNKLYNNILINHHSFRGSISIDASSTAGFQSDYNIVENRLSNDDGNSNMTLTEWQSLGYDLHSKLADPEEQIFVDFLNGNFHLLENAQAVDQGTNSVLPTVFEDLDNNLRPQGNGFDIGCYEYTNAVNVKDENNPEGFELYQNYPNPFNPTTTLSFSIGYQSFVTLKLYDILGKEAATIVNEEKPAGIYQVNFDAAGLPSGIYFYRLSAGKFSSTKKFTVIK